MKKDPAKLTLALLAAGYFLWCAYDPYRWHLIQGVNFFNHEVGHLIFSLFGSEFITVIGGTLLELFMPAAFAYYFFRRGEFYAAAILLFWLGQCMVDVSVYTGDAVVLQLPLMNLGGPASGKEGHDWHYLLGRFGLLPAARQIAALIWFGGTGVIVIAAYFACKYSVVVTETINLQTPESGRPPAAPVQPG